MGIIEIDKLDTLLARHAELKVAVDAFGQTLNEVQRYANETNVVVKDILEGKQISTWVDDLSASGKNSATYKDASRMNALLESKDACRNVNVKQHILDWAVINDKTGKFFGSQLGSVEGVSWDSLTTPTLLCSNANAFQTIANDEFVFLSIIGNAQTRVAIFDQLTTTKQILNDSAIAMKIMKSKKKTISSYKSNSCSWKYYNTKIYAFRAYSEAICCMHKNTDGKVWIMWEDWNSDNPDIKFDYKYYPWIKWVEINDFVVQVGAKNDTRGCSDANPFKFECFDFSAVD